MNTVPEFLTHLRTDQRGVPVPYVNRWGEIADDRVGVETDRHVSKAAAVFLYDEGQQEPSFVHMSPQRQRECMARGLCQICARQVPWSRRFLVVTGHNVDNVLMNRVVTPSVNDPWVDERCAVWARDNCPELLRVPEGASIELVPITSKRQVQFSVYRGYADGPLEGVDQAIQPILWVQAGMLGRPAKAVPSATPV